MTQRVMGGGSLVADPLAPILEQLGSAVIEMVADRVIEALDQSAIGAVVRRRLAAGELAAPAAVKALPPARGRRAPKAKVKTSAAPASKGGRRSWSKMPGLDEWRAKLLGPVLEHPIGSAERGAATSEILEGVHPLPDGTKGRIGKTQLYAWIKELDGAATPAPRPSPATSRDEEAKRRAVVAPILATPKHSRGRKREMLRVAHNQRMSLGALRAWVTQAERNNNGATKAQGE